MINAIDVIDLLPGELAARLECDPFFSDIPVVVAEKGNIAAETARKQAVITARNGKRGVAVIVLQMVADDDEPEIDFGSMLLKPAFQVVENVELNNDSSGTGKSARKVARRIRDVVKCLRLVGLTTDFNAGRNCIEPVSLSADLGANVVAYQVNFTTYEADAESISQVSTPQFAEDAGSSPAVDLLCATVGAQVWYTLDDTFPAPPDSVQGSTAQLYSSPIPIPPQGFTIRAAAYLSGFVASQVNRAAVNVEEIINQQ
jgi:hypothetical protein